MLLYLVRHGETDANAQRKYQGHSQHPLNEAGRRQAERLADVLRSVPIKQFHASDLPRAEETAKILLAPHKRASLLLDPLLRDRDMGSLQGKSWVDYPEQTGAGVETDADLQVRMHTFLDSLIQAHTPLSSPLSTPGPGTPLGFGMAMQTPIAPKDPGSGTVLVCTHESNILALLKLLLEPDLTDGNDKPFEVMGDVQANQQDYFAQTKIKPSARVQLQEQEPGQAADAPAETPFNTHSKLRKIVMAHTSNTVDMTKQCGNTALCVVRVWWEPELNGNGLKACGRVEAWGDVDHLDD